MVNYNEIEKRIKYNKFIDYFTTIIPNYDKFDLSDNDIFSTFTNKPKVTHYIYIGNYLNNYYFLNYNSIKFCDEPEYQIFNEIYLFRKLEKEDNNILVGIIRAVLYPKYKYKKYDKTKRSLQKDLYFYKSAEELLTIFNPHGVQS